MSRRGFSAPWQMIHVRNGAQSMRETDGPDLPGKTFGGPSRRGSASSVAPPVVAVVGYSDSGKTAVVSSLIRTLTGEGYRIASVKHCPHGHEVARPGSDTDRHGEAGAALVVASSPGRLTATERVDGDLPLESIVASMGEGIDLVIAEGFKTSSFAKVLVSSGSPIPEHLDNVIATVGDAARGVPAYDLDTVHLLAEMVRDRFLG